MSLLYFVLALLTLSFLIFIHELGHLFAAMRVGMKVETFAIGFGKPFLKWKWKGVDWQVGWLLFGGYVKIAGMEGEKEGEPPVEGSFYSKTPWQRIQVALAGPVVNLIFAFIAFAAIFAFGGREKPFSEVSPKIGWVDPGSYLYSHGVRPGDEISFYGNEAYENAKDHLTAPMIQGKSLAVKGHFIDRQEKTKRPFELTVQPYPHPLALQKDLLTSGILQPARFLIYDRFHGKEVPLLEDAPLKKSGLELGDRLVWLDGHLLFSVDEIDFFLNDTRALLTIERRGKVMLARVPRVLESTLKLPRNIREELIDWKHTSHLANEKGVLFIPYDISYDGVVEGRLDLIDREDQEKAFPKAPFSDLEEPLVVGDKILAVDGKPVHFAYEILADLQARSVHLIVNRGSLYPTLDKTEVDLNFENGFHPADMEKIAHSIGTANPITASGNLVLLKPVQPITRQALMLKEKNSMLDLLAKKKEIDSITDKETRLRAEKAFEASGNRFLLGVPLQDARVTYNPSPFSLFGQVFSDIWRTLSALFTGSMHPKWLSGPVGIVQVVYDSWSMSIQDALFWCGAISLNLGVLNLLPIPVLDGGTIVLTAIEGITGRRFSQKTLERLIIPFAVLLIFFFLFFTYNDVSRLIRLYFK